MSYLTLMMMALGVVVSAVSGLICYMGELPAYVSLSWVPCNDLLMSYPQTSLVIGGLIIALGVMCQSARVD